MQLLIMTRSEDMTMRVSDKVRLEDRRRRGRGSEKPRGWKDWGVNVEVTRNYNRESRYMFME